MCASPACSRLNEEEPPITAKKSLNSLAKGNGGQSCCRRYRQEDRGRGHYCIILKMSEPTLCRNLCLLLLVTALIGSAQAYEEPYIVKPTPVLRVAGSDDLTTVLLVNNDGVGRLGDSHGRFLSVRPEVGLLTSTARTFIQEGVTTEYATQVVGTTLNNGRQYAQYLKKSSRVLFENGPSVITSWVGDTVQAPQTRSYLESHNDLLNAESPDWRDIDDRLGYASVPLSRSDEFVGNTDFFKVRRVSQLVDLPVASAPSASAVLEPKQISGVNLVARSGHTEDNARKLAAHKVLPIGDLPTITVKNHFEPSGYQTIEVHDASETDTGSFAAEEEGRSAKVYYQDLMQERQSERSQSQHQPLNVPKRVLSTVTYYGFADFTTLVGDSLIVFLPSTSQPSATVGHVTSIEGMATLRNTEVHLPVTTTEDFKISSTSTLTVQSDSTTINTWAVFVDATEATVDDTTTSAVNSAPTPTTSELIMSEISSLSTATPTLDSTAAEKVLSQQISTSKEKPMFSLPTDQEILEIYASLAKAQAQDQAQAVATASENKQTESSISSVQASVSESNLQVHGGATTIFIDDDPFANFVEPTSVATTSQYAAATTTATAEIGTSLEEKQDEEETTTLSNTDESERSTTMGFNEEDGATTLKSGMTGEEENTTEPAATTELSSSQSPIFREISTPDDTGAEKCALIKSQVFLTQVPKSTTILITDDKPDQVPVDIKETTKYYCIQTSQAVEAAQLEKPTIPTAVVQQSFSSSQPKTMIQEETTTLETQTEAVITEATPKEESSTEADVDADDDYVTEPDNTHVMDNGNGESENEDYDGDDGSDEVDLIYKTLYTTYTYLTTFFQGESTTISSHTEIVTNVVTSTLGAGKDMNIKSTDIVAQIGDNEISATQTENVDVKTTDTIKPSPSKYMIPDELESLLHASASDEPSIRDANQQTTFLDDAKYTKTFFTTYTYYTTIFAESETEIMSRTEVFTNYVTEQVKVPQSLSADPTNDIKASTTYPTSEHAVTLSLSGSANPVSKLEQRGEEQANDQEVEKHVTLVTDVRSSSSNGDQQVIGRSRDDDQVSSESNTEEILPSATLLLQTSFTTFTFYTTMYVSDRTNVVSRLETVTNIATETLQPTKVLSHEEATLPITYFTTFTYWTKLAKDGEITTISREETISNVIEPTNRLVFESNSSSISNSLLTTTAIPDDNINGLGVLLQTASSIFNNTINVINTSASVVSEPTTFYTTYTYYTTSYEANKTITDSRFETVTNVVTPTSTAPLEIEPTVLTAVPISVSNSISESNADDNKKDLIFYDYKHIIDADGVSTLYFTTKIQSTLNDEGSAIELTSSTSSLYIDETKKLSLATAVASEGTDQGSASARQYKTGLVRLIEGTRIGNSTTTLYQSKVIGTIIDNRYAQIIESTSSFLFEKAIPAATVLPTATVDEVIVSTTQRESLQTAVAVEGSINSDSGENVTDEPEGSNQEEHDDDADSDTRAPFQTTKRTFAPVIRPFASRNRPTFAPKQKTLTPSSATIITRSDITPTITATPALKSVGRYSSSRRGAISNAPINALDGGPTSTSSRRLFGRPIKPSTGSGISQLGSSSVQASSGFAPSRNRFASSSRSAPISSSKRLSISASYRPSSSPNFRASALNASNSRQRIKPTAAIGQSAASTISPKQPSSDNNDLEEESSTEEQSTGNEEEKAVQNSRRNQNPLLRFRRPLSRPSGFTPVPRAGPASPATISSRRNPLSGRAKTSTTTTTTTTTARPRPRSFQRPTLTSLQARARPQNNLFPPRGLFQQQQKDQGSTENSEVTHNENDADNESEYDDDEDAEEDDADGDAQNEARRRRHSNKNAAILSRKRRQADALSRSRFRFRRPKTVTTEEPITSSSDEPNETTPSAARAKINSRFGSRYQSMHKQPTSSTAPATSSHRAIRPTRPTSARTQFTLREKDTTIKSITRPGTTSSNFRRQQPTIRRNSAGSSGSSGSSPSARRLKSYSNHNNNNNNNNNNVDSPGLRTSSTSRSRANGNASGSSRGRGTMRGRIRNDYNLDTPSTELGSVTITVTHVIPAEVTVPVVNGQVTEYKNIVTGKTSLEVVGPHQYTQIPGNNGQTSLFLVREDSSVNAAGATELTRYLLHDSLTSTVTFTPTTIRGRKTSFSHVLPSTVYSVENVLSTLQPQISANAPLANILLSQLLLGNINLPSNPLLGALGQPQVSGLGTAVEPSVAPVQSPVTEYRTHTSTYVTTIYDGKSTILPITFQGKKILTTVFDTTAQTITATEYSVDTIINTPIQPAQPSAQVAQVNSLLLQQLLLQQQQQQLQQITHTASPQILLSENLQDLEEGARFDTDIDAHDNIDDIIMPAIEDHQAHASKSRKKSRKSHKRNKQPVARPEQENSVITLYVSGRRPGEFSTILSTVRNTYDHLAPSSLHKRHAYAQPIEETASLYNPEDMYEFGESERVQSYVQLDQQQLAYKNMINSGLDDCEEGNGMAGGDCAFKDHTASLESIIGDVDLWYAKATKQAQLTSPTSSTKEPLNRNENTTNSLYFLV